MVALFDPLLHVGVVSSPERKKKQTKMKLGLQGGYLYCNFCKTILFVTIILYYLAYCIHK